MKTKSLYDYENCDDIKIKCQTVNYQCLVPNKKGTPVLDQPEKGEIPKREEPNGDERRRQTVEAQLLLHQLQNARERHQVQTRSHPNPDRARREPVHHSSAIQVHRVRQDVR